MQYVYNSCQTYFMKFCRTLKDLKDLKFFESFCSQATQSGAHGGEITYFTIQFEFKYVRQQMRKYFFFIIAELVQLHQQLLGSV